MRLKNKVALITGASRGIGRAMALLFAQEGASVIVNYLRNQEQAEGVCRQIISAGGKAICVQADVADQTAVNQMVEVALSEFRCVDILVNNAGTVSVSHFLETSIQSLDHMIDVNLKGVIHCVRATTGRMIEQRYGRILNISSIAALGTSAAGTSAYAATKAAVIILTKRLALEFGKYNITVNAIAPGFIKTDMSLRDGILDKDRWNPEAIAQKTMLGRLGEPADIATAALFLVSDESSYITAQVLTIDGGRMDFLSYSC